MWGIGRKGVGRRDQWTCERVKRVILWLAVTQRAVQ